MGFLTRLPGLLVSPRATWVAIAADPAPGMARTLLPLAAAAVAVNLAVAMTRADGWFTTLRGPGTLPGSGDTTVIIGIGPAAISYAAAMLLGVLLLRRSIRRQAILYGAAQDAAAAQKLALYAPFALWLGLTLLPLAGSGLLLLAGLHGLVMLRLGTPILMPPTPGQEASWGWASARRALLVAAGVVTLQFALYVVVAIVWALATALRQMPAPGLST